MIAAALERLPGLLRPTPAWYAALAAALLALIGIEAIGTVEPGYAAIQWQRWLPISLAVMGVAALFHPKVVGWLSWPAAAVVLLTLIYLLIPGVPFVPRINGATSWIATPFMRVQPAEAAKLLFVLSVAWYLRFRDSYRTLPGLLVPFLIMFVPVGLVLKQPDLGSAMLFAPTLFAMLVAAGAKMRHLLSLLGMAVAAVAVVVSVCLFAPDELQVLRPHQQARIVSMVSLASGDTSSINDDGFQQDTAMTLIGAGGLTGNGADRASVLVRYNYLPHDHNDMVFAVVVNRWGLLGAWAVLGLYGVFVGSLLLVAARSKDPFVRLSCVGFAALTFTQASINIGMHIGLLPITGITLPFVSYGGSSLVVSFAMVGLALGFAAARPKPLARPSFEFDHADAIFQ
ncbi:MAG: FtsW/RodA/SpoVE family cell cycle protein [Planctomycetota bacterium]